MRTLPTLQVVTDEKNQNKANSPVKLKRRRSRAKANVKNPRKVVVLPRPSMSSSMDCTADSGNETLAAVSDFSSTLSDDHTEEALFQLPAELDDWSQTPEENQDFDRSGGISPVPAEPSADSIWTRQPLPFELIQRLLKCSSCASAERNLNLWRRLHFGSVFSVRNVWKHHARH